MTTDNQLATLRQIYEVRRALRVQHRMLVAIIAVQIINLILGLTRL